MRGDATPTASARPRSAEEVRAALESCGLAGRVDGRLGAGGAARPTRTRPGGRRRAGAAGRPRPRLAAAQRRRLPGTPSRSHRPLRRLRSAETRRSRRRTSGQEERARERAARHRRADAQGAGAQGAHGAACSSWAPACVVVARAPRRPPSSSTSRTSRDESEGRGHAARASSASRRPRPSAMPVKTVDANGSGPAHRPGQEDPLPRRAARVRPALGRTSCRARRSAASTPSTTGPSSSGWCTASSTATRSSGTTTP